MQDDQLHSPAQAGEAVSGTLSAAALQQVEPLSQPGLSFISRYQHAQAASASTNAGHAPHLGNPLLRVLQAMRAMLAAAH